MFLTDALLDIGLENQDILDPFGLFDCVKLSPDILLD